jgi:hypothetical protein
MQKQNELRQCTATLSRNSHMLVESEGFWWWCMHWVYGLCPSPGIPNTRKHNVSEITSITGRETSTLLDPLERADLNHWEGDVYSVGSLRQS